MSKRGRRRADVGALRRAVVEADSPAAVDEDLPVESLRFWRSGLEAAMMVVLLFVSLLLFCEGEALEVSRGTVLSAYRYIPAHT